jgi:hypothetical protein
MYHEGMIPRLISAIIRGDRYHEYVIFVKRKAIPGGTVKMMEKQSSDIEMEETWVNVTESAELLGYHRMTISKLAQANWNLPENEREIQIKRHTHGYMLWLPDLIKYAGRKGHGPLPKRKSPKT